jgi:bacillithiol biosynthesis cysteine-adding enzyme BshC
MHIEKIPFESTQAFTQAFLDYINQHDSLKDFYNRFPTVKNFQLQIHEKKKAFDSAHRHVLVNALKNQYKGYTLQEVVSRNIESLTHENTFTVTTGHQLNIFTGPLYFIYKIVTVITACRALQKKYPAYTFVPVYWMASEDHDYDEIKSFRLYEKEYSWHTSQQGAVGRFHLKDFDALLRELPGNIEVFRKAYTEYGTLTQAVRYYVNELFGDDGLVLVDGDDRDLKSLFKKVILDDLTSNTSKKLVDQKDRQLEQRGYKPQIHCREINLFYLDHQVRSRIEKQGDIYRVVDTDLAFSEAEIKSLVETCPEKFSPNVILRPVYQEAILPNLAYAGGPAEVVYWLQLKSVFEHYAIPFPILMPRNFALVFNETAKRKYEKSGLTLEELFFEKNYLFNHFILKHSREKVVLNGEKEAIYTHLTKIKQQAELIDKTLGPMVAAETKKSLKSLEKIEQKMLRAEKRFQSDKLRQLEALKDMLFPNGSLQERTDNFLNFYQQDNSFIKKLLSSFDPFDFRLHVLYL